VQTPESEIDSEEAAVGAGVEAQPEDDYDEEI
jgi:hypothetical protein